MLSNELKQTIQQAYSQFLESRQLTARYGQKLMVAEIARTLGGIKLDADEERESEGHVCVIEAGTGTGKTVAYLLAAIPVAKALGKKLVISTATVALQEQIIHKDLPELRENSGLDFTFSLAKGRGRYLCLSKLDTILMEYQEGMGMPPALYEDELPSVDEQTISIYSSMVDAMAANQWNGDRDNWTNAVDDTIWSRVTTDHRQCTGRRCSNASSCSFFKARDNMGNVDCIVTNHDLVLADLALGGGAILPAPADTLYIFDEGHHLPDKALNHFAHHSRVLSTSKWLDQCNKSLGPMLGAISGAGDIDRFAEKLPAVLTEVKRSNDQVFPILDGLIGEHEREDQSARVRFEQGIVPENLYGIAQDMLNGFDRLTDLLSKIVRELDDVLEHSHPSVPKVDLETWYPVVGSWLSRAEASSELWASYATRDKEESVPRARWATLVDYGGSIDFELCSSPILAAHTLNARLWQQCCGAVVTSATLTALGRFDRFRMRAGTPPDSAYAVVPSPFDYASAATLRIPEQATDAGNASVHTQSLIDALPELLDESEGSLVLFSSRRQMQDVYDALEEPWQSRILLQGDRSKQETLNEHRKRIDQKQGSVLFGLASFAEGLDLPGNYCSHVVIAKIPFAVPDDPVDAALAEWIEKRGGNPFMEITVPDASLKLVQACGRLLRTETDTGVISLLDKRMVTRRYGKPLLNSLPPFRRDM